ncbi:permease prefix domain 1-containing protein [Polymorphospora sp. NPDC050346]|uniref:permease prefix domain 1-containing protein n=1 Tax=Polymorphospora sp. NPDC050346 TaxID=3155780 RepID=UPI0033E8C2BB
MTDTNTLTDRYIAAALHSVPTAERDDLERELRASIADAVDGRVEAGETPPAAERATLEDLGDPAHLAARYLDRPTFLLGPAYYFTWLRLLKTLLLIVLPIGAIAAVAVDLLDGMPPQRIVGTVVTSVLAIGVHLTFWTTLVFVVLERSGAKNARPAGAKGVPSWSLDMLPDVARRTTGVAELVVMIVGTVLFAFVVIWQQQVGFVRDDAGDPVPFLRPELWGFWIPALFVLLAVSVALAVARYRAGRPSGTLVLASAALNVVGWTAALVLLLRGELVDTRFFDRLDVTAATGDWNVVYQVTAVIIAATVLWTIVDDVVKWRRAARDAG